MNLLRPERVCNLNNCLYFILLILLNFSAVAQKVEFQTFWDNQVGSTTIEDLVQDELGFIWVATQAGLVRFDGYDFITYKHDSENNNSLDDNITRVLLPTKNHKIWVGSMTGVNLFDPQTDEFQRFDFPSNENENYLGVTSLIEYKDELIIGSENGLFHLDINSNTIKPYPIYPVANEPYHSITQLLVNQSQQLWVSTKESLFLLDLKSNSFKKILDSDKDDIIVDLFEDNSANIWVRWSTGKIQVLDPSNLKHPKMQLQTNDMLAGFFPSWHAMIQPNENEIWIGTNSGLTILDAFSGKILTHQINTSGTIKSLIVDHSGLIWAGIDGSGLGKNIPQNDIKLFNQGLKMTSVGAVSEINNEIWIGTRGDGIYRLNKKSDALSHLDISSMTTPQNDGFIRDIVKVKDSIWVATNYAGLLKLDLNGDRLLHFDKSNGLPSNQTFSLAVDSKDNLWVGTLDKGLAIIDTTSNSVQNLTVTKSSTPILDVVITEQDTAYLATPAGLIRILENGNIQTFSKDSMNQSTLVSNFIVSLLIDQSNRLWIGTRDGLSLLNSNLDKEKGELKFQTIESERFKLDSFVDGILEGLNNDIWIARGSELLQINLEDNHFKQFNTSDGIPKGGYWVGSHQVMQNQTLMFATKNGVLFVNPNAVSWDYHPKTVITQINNGRQISRNSLLKQLSIKPDKNYFSLEFASLDYSAPDNNIYSYQLIGFDDDWITVDSSHRIATYTNLDPGNYQFKVKGTNRNQEWSDFVTTIDITVLPAYHEKIWFKILILLISLTLIYFLVLWRIRQVNVKQLVLSKKLKQKNKEIENLNIRLTQSKNFDFLTSLPNRNGFIEAAKTQIQVNTKSSLCLAICKIDGIINFNHTYDFHMGDSILQQFAIFLKESIRNVDLVARWGGDEFSIIFTGADSKTAKEICQQIIQDLNHKVWQIEGEKIELKAAFGLCQYNKQMELEECITRSEKALYQTQSEIENKIIVSID